MFKSVLSKVAWVGRTASMVLGLALVMALVFGVASMALGATGDNFLLGKKNVADAISTLVKKGPGPALSLVVEANQPPLKVNSKAKVANLNADTVDGLEGASFVQGGGRASQGMVAIPAGTSTTVLETSNSNIQVRYSCPSISQISQGTPGSVSISSPGSTEDVNVLVENVPRFDIIHHFLLSPNGQSAGIFDALPDGAHFTIQAQGANVATIEMFSFHRATDCHAQAQALVTR